MFSRVLIANRGEVAVRIMRTCQRLGIETVAVYSWEDRNALHVRTADRAVAIGPATPAESYLNGARIVEAAKAERADAVHPGYGFLSENADFAHLCKEAGLAWVGPAPETIALMADKARARERMEAAGVPVLPGFDAEGLSPQEIEHAARGVSYPLLVKATAGGGGRGMRRVGREEELTEAMAAAGREAGAAFGDDRVLVERLVDRARHVEVQVLADAKRHVLHLFERDCSIQRRHQKVIEESPAPGLDEKKRNTMTATACRVAEAVDYLGAGTVEFLLAPDGGFFFIEMNTRLQVEHPVTELLTGIDIVEWQLRIAAGEPLGFTQDDIRMQGHAIEARVCAEEPERDFRPSPGEVLHADWPGNARVDAGFETGDRVSAHYDSLLAKVIAHAGTRAGARKKLRDALGETRIAGPSTNLRFLENCLDDPAFETGGVDTGFVPPRIKSLTEVPLPSDAVLGLSGLAILLAETAENVSDPWALGDGWRFSGSSRRTFVFERAGEETEVSLMHEGGGRYSLQVGETVFSVQGRIGRDGILDAEIDGKRKQVRILAKEDEVQVLECGGHWRFPRLDRTARAGTGQTGGGLAATMPGRVVSIEVSAGDRVSRGAMLAVVEAMKIEQRIEAPQDGVVTQILVETGMWLDEGAPLVEFKADSV